MDQVIINHQQKVIVDFLRSKKKGATRLQIAKCVLIERATICRRVAELRDMGIVHIHHEGLDPLTNTKAEFLAL